MTFILRHVLNVIEGSTDVRLGATSGDDELGGITARATLITSSPSLFALQDCQMEVAPTQTENETCVRQTGFHMETARKIIQERQTGGSRDGDPEFAWETRASPRQSQCKFKLTSLPREIPGQMQEFVICLVDDLGV